VDVHVQGVADGPLDPVERTFLVDLHATAEEEVGVEVPEREVGVGHGGLGPAAVVTDGTGLGARTLRADGDAAGVVGVRDGATAGADLDHVDDGEVDGEAAPLLHLGLVDLEHVGPLRLAVDDEADLRRCPAHVEREHVVDAELLTERGRIERARNGAGLDDLDRRPRA
jgi:hypothetical protein